VNLTLASVEFSAVKVIMASALLTKDVD